MTCPFPPLFCAASEMGLFAWRSVFSNEGRLPGYFNLSFPLSPLWIEIPPTGIASFLREAGVGSSLHRDGTPFLRCHAYCNGSAAVVTDPGPRCLFFFCVENPAVHDSFSPPLLCTAFPSVLLTSYGLLFEPFFMFVKAAFFSSCTRIDGYWRARLPMHTVQWTRDVLRFTQDVTPVPSFPCASTSLCTKLRVYDSPFFDDADADK